MIDRFRRHKRVYIALILVLMLCGGWVGIYAYTSGFTQKWRRSLQEEFAKRGLTADIGRITLDPARGLVAREVRFYYDKNKKIPMAKVNRISLDVDYTKLLRKEMFLQKIEFRDAHVWLRADPDRLDRGRIEISGIRASIRLPKDRIEIDKAEGNIFGFRIGLRGTLLKPLRGAGSETKGLSSPDKELIPTSHQFFSDIAEFLKPFNSRGGRQPHIDFEIGGDLGDLETIEARCLIETGKLAYGKYEFEEFRASGDYKLGTFAFNDINLRDQSGVLAAECAIDMESGAITFSADSTADAVGIVQEVIGRPPLGTAQLYSSPHLNLRGTIDRVPDSWSDTKVFPGKLYGRCELESFGDERILFERFATDFSIDHEKIYLRNAELEHHTGPASCDFLYDPKEGLQFEATLKMDPTSLAPFLPQGPDRAFLEDWQFERVASVHIEVKGSGPGFRTRAWTASGTANIIGAHRFRQFPMRSIQVAFQRRPGHLELTKCEAETATGNLTAGQILHDDETGITTFVNVRGPMHPAAAAEVIAPPLKAHLESFQFAEAPEVTLNGSIDTTTGEADLLSVQLRSDSRMDFETPSGVIPLDKVETDLLLRGNTLTIERASGLLGEGQVNLSGTVVDVFAEATSSNTTFVLEAVPLGELKALLSVTDLKGGTVSGSVTLRGSFVDHRTIEGSGELEMKNTNLFQLPVLSELRSQIGKIYAEQKTDYGLMPSAVLDLELQTDTIDIMRLDAANGLFGFSMSGKIDRNGENVKLGSSIRPKGDKRKLLGLIGEFLSYECSGTVAHPKWKARHRLPLKLNLRPEPQERPPVRSR